MKSKMHHGITPSLNHEPSGPNPMRSSKRAVLCGITYNNWKQYKLKGTVNDVRSMRDLLSTRFGYPTECIRVLTGMLLLLIIQLYEWRYVFFPLDCHD